MPSDDLYGSYNFLLEIAGTTADAGTITGGFSAVSGMASETEVVTFRGGHDRAIRKLPGRTTYGDIVLERGFTGSDELWRWRRNIEDGILDRRAGTLTILDQDLTSIVAQFHFYEAWPCKWVAPEMAARASGMAIEALVLAVERIERA